MGLDGLVRHVQLTVEPASLQETANAFERLRHALRSRLDDRPRHAMFAAWCYLTTQLLPSP